MGARRTSGWIAAALVSLAATSLTAGVVVAAPDQVHTTGPTVKGGDLGRWQVEHVGGDQYVVSWTSPTAFPAGSDRPSIVGLRGSVSAPTVAADGRTVRVTVTAPSRPDPAGLDVVLSGDRLDERGDDRLRRAAEGSDQRTALDLPGTVTLPVDPSTPGSYAVTTSDYTLDPVKVAGMPEPIEMVGHVVEPTADAATGPRPLVLFLHGRHSVCYNPDDPKDWGGDEWPCQSPYEEIPSQLGYDYIQQVLASQGYATVSVRVNGINAQDYRLDDGGADARAQIVQAHLDHWVDLAADHEVDLSRVVLVGHSRGGEGVDRASIQIPLSAPYRIVGQVLIAPTDFATQTAPYVPTVTLLPFCDGDVSDLQGQKFTDTARDIAADDTSLKSSVMVMGANHNYFNTEWTKALAKGKAAAGDDWGDKSDAACGRANPDRLSAAQQRDVGLAYVAGAVHLFADDEQDLLPMFDGSRARVESQGVAQTLSHAIGGGRDVRKPGVSTGLSLASGADTRFCDGKQDNEQMAACSVGVRYANVVPHWPSSYEPIPTRDEFQMTWTAAGQSGGMTLDTPLDLSDGDLELRTIVDPKSTDVDLRVRITDGDGASALLTPVGGGTLPALDGSPAVFKFWAQTLEVDPSAATGVDLTRITRVDLVAQSASGRIWVVDLGSAPRTLAAVPARRVPTLDVSKAVIDEGDKRGPAIARLPFQVVGDVDRPARFVVLTTGQDYGSEQRFTVDLAPGQTSGSIPIAYTADRRDDYPRQITQVVTWPIRNVMTDSYIGQLTIRDDDPTPRITVKPVHKRIDAGAKAVWRIKLAAWVDYDMSVSGRVVAGPGRDVHVSDIAKHWVLMHVGQIKKDPPLWKTGASVWEQIPRGQKMLDIAIPTSSGGKVGQTKSITLRFKLPGQPKMKSTIEVVTPRAQG